mgnify:CR=1 FL=1
MKEYADAMAVNQIDKTFQFVHIETDVLRVVHELKLVNLAGCRVPFVEQKVKPFTDLWVRMLPNEVYSLN